MSLLKLSTIVVALVSLVGCDSGTSLSPVKGIVTFDGKPYPNAQVRFVPASGRPSIGMTDDSGVYTLTYIRDEKGAVPGAYKVDITTVYTSTSDSDGGKEPKEKIPPKYNTLTELNANVEKGENVINFDMVSR